MIDNALPQSLLDNPRLGQWLSFAGAGRVRLATGKVEIGQGVLTALAQIAAEELEIQPQRLVIVSGETGASPNEGSTTGSNSIRVGGSAVRLVCAETRQLFLDRLAELLSCRRDELTVENGSFLRNGAATGYDYWSVAVDLDRAATGTVPTRRPADYQLVGRSLPRLDLPAKIVGGGFIHDILPQGVLHARVLRPPRRGAACSRLDEAAIRRAAREPVEILREGEFIAFLADDEAVAMRAVEAGWRHSTWEGGACPGADVDQPAYLRARSARTRMIATGGSASAAGGRTVQARYSRPFLAHASIATCCALAEMRDGRLQVWCHSQAVFALRQSLGRALGLEPGLITVHHRQGAGCYGHNGADDAAFDAAFIATRMPGRMVRVQWMRQDELSASPFGAAMTVEIRAVIDADIRPVDWTIEIWSPPHAGRPGMSGNANLLGAESLPGTSPPSEMQDAPDSSGGGATRNAHALYDLPLHRLIHHRLVDVPVRTSSLRGLGTLANIFAIESFIDELAEIAREDPVAYRLSLTADPRMRAVIETAAEMAGWQEGAHIGEGRAKGLGFARYKNSAAYMAAVAEVEVEEDVRVLRLWCAVDAGLVINPDGAASQIEGGAIQAVSWVLKEQVRFEDGRIVSDAWERYPILRFSEVPEVTLRFLDRRDLPALGVGEAAVGPTAAAIGNAVARALGTRIYSLPLSRERIMETLLSRDSA